MKLSLLASVGPRWVVRLLCTCICARTGIPGLACVPRCKARTRPPRRPSRVETAEKGRVGRFWKHGKLARSRKQKRAKLERAGTRSVCY